MQIEYLVAELLLDRENDALEIDGQFVDVRLVVQRKRLFAALRHDGVGRLTIKATGEVVIDRSRQGDRLWRRVYQRADVRRESRYDERGNGPETDHSDEHRL